MGFLDKVMTLAGWLGAGVVVLIGALIVLVLVCGLLNGGSTDRYPYS